MPLIPSVGTRDLIQSVIEILFGECSWFENPDPCRLLGFKWTIFSWRGAWGMKGRGEILKSSWRGMLSGRLSWVLVGWMLAGWMSEWLAWCLPVGYSGVHKPHCKRPHFLLALQRQPGSLTGWCLTSGLDWLAGRLAGWQHLTLHHCFSMAAKPASCH